MHLRLLEPSRSKGESGGNSNQHGKASQRNYQVGQLPQEVSQPWALPAAPALANAALSRHHAVEQNEPHHAADVHQDDSQNQPCDDEHRDEADEQGGVDSRQPRIHKAVGAWVLIQIEVAAIAAAARATVAGQQPDQRQLGHLPKPEGLEKLFPGVFKGRINRIHGGESQARTSASIECEGRYCKRTNGSNKFCSEDNPLRLLTEICSAASNALR